MIVFTRKYMNDHRIAEEGQPIISQEENGV